MKVPESPCCSFLVSATSPLSSPPLQTVHLRLVTAEHPILCPGKVSHDPSVPQQGLLYLFGNSPLFFPMWNPLQTGSHRAAVLPFGRTVLLKGSLGKGRQGSLISPCSLTGGFPFPLPSHISHPLPQSLGHGGGRKTEERMVRSHPLSPSPTCVEGHKRFLISYFVLLLTAAKPASPFFLPHALPSQV